MDYSKYKAIPFWSWNDKLEIKELEEQIEWMKANSFGGYFMHARGGLKTEYLGEHWFDCVRACCEKGEQLGIDTWAYDENGWPSGFVGGKLLEDENNKDKYLTYTIGEYDSTALVSYLITEDKLQRVTVGGEGEYLNVFDHFSPSTADILNEKVVDKFIKETHERYKKEVGKDFNKKIKGFFTDEPQYYRWKQPYTQVLPEYFLKTYNEDILDGLGLLFVEKEGYRAFRYKFWLAMQTLMLTAFAEKIYNWCVENGVEFTGHYLEETSLTWQMKCCAGIMPFYMYETMPGIDKLGRHLGFPIAPKQVSSVAQQTGKKRVLVETFGVTGWDTTPLELKMIAEMTGVNGTNVVCQHLVPYSEHGERKRDHPAHFSPVNPWVKHDYKTFNEYFAKIGCLVGESKELVNIGVFCPIRSVYFDYKHGGQEGLPVNNSYDKYCKQLSKENVPYHIIDETVVERIGKVEGNKFIVGECSYEYLVFPMTITMGKTMQKYLQEFYDNGGKILFFDGEPTYLEGEPFEYGFTTNCEWNEILKAQPYSVAQKDTEVVSTCREINGKKFIYAANITTKNSYDIDFDGDFKGFVSYDIETGKKTKMSKRVHFEPGDSYVLFFSDEEVEYKPFPEFFTVKGPFEIKEVTDNYLTLDNARYSFDGVNYSEQLRCMGIFKELLKGRYDGDLYLKYEFDVQKIPSRIDLLAEDMNTISTFVNGHEIKYTGVSDFEKQLYRANIADYVKEGKNEVIIKIHYYQDEFVYYVLTGSATESLRNLLSYGTTIEACYLQGDFGVYAKDGMTLGKNSNVLLGENFYIAERQTTTCGDIVKDGYPFFMGKIVLGCKYNADGSEQMLKLAGRHQLSEVCINGEKVEKSYFTDRVDVSGRLKKGENDVEISLWLAPRNLLGPHHVLSDEEPTNVGPQSWELGGTWVDGKSTHERDNYSFVRLGLHD